MTQMVYEARFPLAWFIPDTLEKIHSFKSPSFYLSSQIFSVKFWVTVNQKFKISATKLSRIRELVLEILDKKHSSATFIDVFLSISGPKTSIDESGF